MRHTLPCRVCRYARVRLDTVLSASAAAGGRGRGRVCEDDDDDARWAFRTAVDAMRSMRFGFAASAHENGEEEEEEEGAGGGGGARRVTITRYASRGGVAPKDCLPLPSTLNNPEQP